MVIVAAWLFARLLGGRRADVGRQPVVLASLGLLVATALSALLGLEPRLSFFGSFDRGMGWLTLAACVGLLVTGADLWSDPVRRERAITALLLGACVPCAYALLQRLGRDPVAWTTLGTPGSSLGSPTFLGGFLVLVAPFGLYRVVQTARAGPGARYVGWLALVLVMAATVAQTGIRGPLVGLAAGSLTFAMLAVRLAPRRFRQIGLAAMAGFLVVTLGLAYVSSGAAGLRGLTRFMDVRQPIDSSSERLTAWADVLPMPLASPLRVVVGFGPESQAALFERAEATVRRTMNQRWDRVHNLVLDAWLTGGLLGVLALCGALGAGAWSAVRAIRDGGHVGLLAAAVLAALVGHVVEVSFAFHTVVTGAWLFVALALAASLRPSASEQPRVWAPRLAAITIGVGVLLAPLVSTPSLADATYGAAQRATRAGNLGQAALQAESAANLAPWVEELPRFAGLRWQQLARRGGDAVDGTLLYKAEADLLLAADRAPFDPSAWLRLARLYQIWGVLDRAEAACARALLVGPYRAAVWDTCASISAQRGEADQAAARRERAQALSSPL